MNSSCQHTEQVSAWIDGELPHEEAEALELHLAVCPVCQDEVEAIRQLSSMFSVFRRGLPPRMGAESSEPALFSRVGFRKMLSLAALVLIGLGAIFSLKSDLQDDELRFERYLDRSLDQDVLEMTALGDDDFSRDRVVGLLVSSTH